MKTNLNGQWHYLSIVTAAKTYLASAWNLNLLFLFLAFGAYSQNTGSIKIQVLDKKNPNEVIPFANVIVFKDSQVIMKAITDLDGNAIMRTLNAGVYKIKVVYIGYQPQQMSGVLVLANKDTHLTMYLSNEGVELNEIVITDYSIPIIDVDTKSGGTVTREQFQKMSNKSSNGVISTTSGVYQQDNGAGLNIRGGRSSSTNVFIDGERAIGTSNIPQQTIEQVSVLLGGLPAQYGDVTGGAIFNDFNNINTLRYYHEPIVNNLPKVSPPVNTEEYGVFIENGFNSVNGAPLSTFAIDVDAASYSNTRRMLSQGYLPPKDAVRIEEFINYFKYNYPKVTGDKPFSIFSEYNECPWNKAHKLLQVVLKGKEIDNLTAAPNHLVFLIDVSGSMSDMDKLPLLKQAFKLLIKQLRPQDKLSVVVYAGSSGLILENVGGDKKGEITESMERLEAGGSTAGGEGINLAYKIAEKHFIKNGNNRVVLATDGDFNVGVSGDKELEDLIVEKRELGIYLSVLGFGQGNIKDSKMEILADKGNGNYYYIDNFAEARKVLVSQFGGTMCTIAKDVKIQLEFNPAKVKEYRLIGYDNRLLAAEDFNNDKKDAGELGAGHCVTAIYEIIPAGSSESLTKIDELKYSKVCVEEASTEIATIKFRYKGVQKEDTVSKLIRESVMDAASDISKASANFKLAAGICEFTMLLKDSDYKGTSSFKEALSLVGSAKGSDEEGYISGLIEMINIAKEIKPYVASKK